MAQRRIIFGTLCGLLWAGFVVSTFGAEDPPEQPSCCVSPEAEARPAVANTVSGFMTHLWDTSSYPARWNCGSWTPLEGWLHILSDVGIFTAYFAIPLALLYFMVKRRDVPFHGIILLFAAFILCCGTGHLLEAVIFYYPIYRVAGLLKLVTAIVSIATFFALLKWIPRALEMPTLASANEVLRQTDAMKTEFMANMSHEIRTPMTAILGFSELLLAPETTEEERTKAAQTIHRNGRHLVELINDILDLTKVEAGKLEIERRVVNLHELLEDVIELLADQARSRGNMLQLDLSGNLPERIESDPTRLKQALVNLVGNAIKFTHKGQVQVTVHCDWKEERLMFDVVDSGIGIAPEHIEHIFEPFRQADSSTTRKFGGTGLGLAITKRIAQILGGDVTVESELGRGSCFSLSVATGPLEGVSLMSVHKPSPAKAVTANVSVKIEGRVLLVEDGLDNQRLISFLLKRAGVEVVLAENGQLGLDVALTAWRSGNPFGVILMDMQMPVMDGYTSAARLREAGYPGQIIALTAHVMQSEVAKCLAAGCDAFLPKPIDQKTFLAEIEARMPSKAGVEPSATSA